VHCFFVDLPASLLYDSTMLHFRLIPIAIAVAQGVRHQQQHGLNRGD
jgi:hypothetical protein